MSRLMYTFQVRFAFNYPIQPTLLSTARLHTTLRWLRKEPKPLPEVITNYGQVAKMVNHREMDRFIARVRSRWDPPSHEEEYRFKGWTSESAFTKCVYQLAFYSHDCPQPVVDPNGNATDAEVNEQVQTKPSLNEIMNYV